MTRSMPTSRTGGLTLIETLVALVLLSGVAVATAVLLRSVSDVHAGVTPQLRWATHAERALQCVADDMSIGDRDAREPHVNVHEGELVVRSRGHDADGSVVRLEVRYELEAGSERLVRRAQVIDNRQRPIGPAKTSTLLGSVNAFDITPILTSDPDRRGDEPPLAYKLELRSGDIVIIRVVRP